MTSSLAPPSVTSSARPRKLLAFGFGPRFFVAFLLGLLWLIPAWWSPGMAFAMFWWDLALLAFWLFDLFTLPQPAQFEVERLWFAPLLLARPSSVTVLIRNAARSSVQIIALDHTPPSFRAQPPALSAAIPSNGFQSLQYEIVPSIRGYVEIGDFYLRYRSFWGFAERWAVAPLSQTLSVLPDLVQARDQAVFLIRSRQIELGQRTRRQRGLGREFESLRDYRHGDEYRNVCWTATARRDQLVTRTYEAERSQSIWILLDCGRLLGARVQSPQHAFTLSKLDYSVNAALSLTEVAVQAGDRVGMLGYGRSVQRAVACHRGPAHVGSMIQALAHLHAEPREANHWFAGRMLLQKQTRRSLVVWITDFAETAAMPEVVECAMHLTRRHLVLVAAVSQPDLVRSARQSPETETELYRHAAAREIADRREVLLRTLRQSGVLALELVPERLAVSIVNEYLLVKERNQL